MSFKLFYLQTFKGLKNTQKVESEYDSLLKDYQDFCEIEGSEKLKLFIELDNEVNSDSFKKHKKEVKSLKYHGSAEEKQYNLYTKLKSDSSIKAFYEAEAANDTEAKAYTKMVNSPDRKQFEELKAEVESDEFKQRKAYLEDDQKWEKSEACQKEQEYEKMKSDPLFVNYLKYNNSNAFDFFKNWDLVFEDRFDGDKLDESKWQTVALVAENTAGQNFSQMGDLQAYTNGENVNVKNNHLQLVVKKEKTKTMVWNYATGFVVEEMDYSAGLVSTGSKFQPKYGILEAKIKYDPKKQLEDVFYLSDTTNEHRLNLLECGKVNRFGVTSKTSALTESLSGLSTGQYYIFRMEWSQGKVVWKINNHEIHSVTSNVPDSPLSLNLSTIVIDPMAELSHNFDIDWVRFFQKK